jgi:hypothetical protein
MHRVELMPLMPPVIEGQIAHLHQLAAGATRRR